MTIWLQNRRMRLFCSLILFLCMFLFASGVTGQQSTMAQQGWSLPSISHTVLGVLNISVTLAVFWNIRKLKQKDDFRLMEEGRSLLAEGQLNEQIDRFQEENERLQRENKQQNEKIGQLNETIGQLNETIEQLEREKRQLNETIGQLNETIEFLRKQRHKEGVTLDPDSAHPRLEISDDGKSVKDTGTIRNVPKNEKRFDSHTFVLAKEGYTSGRHYWEVDVGKRRSWALGIAHASVTRKGTLTLSPKNGFWVMGCTDGREYWAYTEPWTRLSVGGKVPKIGIFLDISAKQLSFYNVRKKAALHTFTIADGSSREGKLLPFFSTGPATAKPDTEPLKIVQGFDDDE